MTVMDYFEKNGYVVLTDVLSKETCQYLTEYMFNLVKQEKTQKDEQCPLSDGIYGDPEFDKLLEDLCFPIGKQIGRNLLPTYTYARIYRPGEVLKKHKDRSSCEISATLTLGFDGKKVWPIFFDGDKHIPLELYVGEMAVYKGCELVHWRDEFKGNWHVQVFLHYVDADGPYSDFIFDKRGGLSHHKESTILKQVAAVPVVADTAAAAAAKLEQIKIPKNDNFPGYINLNKNNWTELIFTKEECESIINIAKYSYSHKGLIGGSEDTAKMDYNVRTADIYPIPNDDTNQWIYKKVSNAVQIANILYFDYDIEVSSINNLIQLIHYKYDPENPGHYDWHVDCGEGDPSTRKISFVAQLSSPDDYEGCELIVDNHGFKIQASKDQGSINMFPSYQTHKVNHITSGERFALVVWIHGQRRFK